ncbi:MAG: LysR family transcriptional regulator [Paracoccaceae bacterium]
MPRAPDDPARRDELIRQGLRFSQLRLLVALEDTGQVSAAAAQLAMTQPAASRLLAELERIVGATLSRRRARGTELTEAGRLLALRARAVLRQLDQSAHEIAQVATGTRGRVRIGSVTGPSMEVVLPAIRTLTRTEPDIELSVEIDTSDRLAEALLARELDFYIGRLPRHVDAAAVRLRLVGPEPVSLIARGDHPLTRAGPVTLERCLGHEWVMQPPGTLLRRTVETYLLERGHPPPARTIGTTSLLLTLAIVERTDAVAPVARAIAAYCTAPGAPGDRIRRLAVAEDMAVSPYAIVERQDGMRPPSVARVLAAIEQHLPREPASP